MRRALQAAELAGLFVACCILGLFYMVFVAPDEREQRARQMRADD